MSCFAFGRRQFPSVAMQLRCCTSPRPQSRAIARTQVEGIRDLEYGGMSVLSLVVTFSLWTMEHGLSENTLHNSRVPFEHCQPLDVAADREGTSVTVVVTGVL